MDSDICELPFELTIDELTDDELDVAAGGVSLTYGEIKVTYTPQKADG
jgi:hypothetical protein